MLRGGLNKGPVGLVEVFVRDQYRRGERRGTAELKIVELTAQEGEREGF
jgi:hypothetical protein